MPTAYSGHSAEQLQQPLTLFDILQTTSHRHAKDPRDKVFAVLGLVRDDRVGPLMPDYTQTIAETYQQATFNISQSACNLDVLHRLNTQERRAELPSWCVNFETNEWKPFEQAGRWYPFSEDARFHATRGLAVSQFHHDLASGQLVLDGMRIGAVCKITPSSFDRYIIADVAAIRTNKSPEDHEYISAGMESLKKISADVVTFTIFAYGALTKRQAAVEATALLARGLVWETMNAGRPYYSYPLSLR